MYMNDLNHCKGGTQWLSGRVFDLGSRLSGGTVCVIEQNTQFIPLFSTG